MVELSGGHLKLLLLLTHGDLLQLSLQVSLGLEEVVGQCVLQVVLLGLQLYPFSQTDSEVLLHGINIFCQFLHLENKAMRSTWLYALSLPKL